MGYLDDEDKDGGSRCEGTIMFIHGQTDTSIPHEQLYAIGWGMSLSRPLGSTTTPYYRYYGLPASATYLEYVTPLYAIIGIVFNSQ